MGFRKGAYCTVWEVEPKSDYNTRVRISISRKNKDTGEYDNEFSYSVSFLGTACADKATRLERGTRIKLGDVDVTTKYDKEKERTYVNFKVFGFEDVNGGSASSSGESGSDNTVSHVEEDDTVSEEDNNKLPF